jgi:hypothetical protein
LTSPLASILSLLEDKPYGRLLKIVAIISHELLFKIFDWTTYLFAKLSGSSEGFWMRRYCNYFLYYLDVYDKAVMKEAGASTAQDEESLD